MNLNHMVCPNCGHDFYTDAAPAKCDACQCVFCAAQSRTCRPPAKSVAVGVNPWPAPPIPLVIMRTLI